MGTLNPFRYRGYVYDEETGLYYLRSRYYNPEWGRFVNGDSCFDDNAGLFGKNLYTYCANSPINGCDPNGTNFLSDLGSSLHYWWIKPYEDRYKAMLDDPSVYSVGNWLTSGVFGTVKGAVAPKQQLSLEHWIDSAATVLLFFPIMKGISNFIPVKTPITINPLARVTYSDAVISKMSNAPIGEYHNFSMIIDNFGSSGRMIHKVGGDGAKYIYLTIEGSFTKTPGVFEYIIDTNNQVTHRLFRVLK